MPRASLPEANQVSRLLPLTAPPNPSHCPCTPTPLPSPTAPPNPSLCLQPSRHPDEGPEPPQPHAPPARRSPAPPGGSRPPPPPPPWPLRPRGEAGLPGGSRQGGRPFLFRTGPAATPPHPSRPSTGAATERPPAPVPSGPVQPPQPGGPTIDEGGCREAGSAGGAARAALGGGEQRGAEGSGARPGSVPGLSPAREGCPGRRRISVACLEVYKRCCVCVGLLQGVCWPPGAKAEGPVWGRADVLNKRLK